MSTEYKVIQVWDFEAEEAVTLLGDEANALAEEFEQIEVEVELNLADAANVIEAIVDLLSQQRAGSPEHTRLSLLVDRFADATKPVARPIIEKHIAAHRARL